MEGVRCARAMCRGIGQRINDLQLLDDRAGPSVRDDERQRIFMLRSNVNEMNVDAVDFGHEHRQRVQPRLYLAPVVGAPPVADDFLEFRELITLRTVRNGFLVGPAGFGNTPAEISKGGFGNVNLERADRAVGNRRSGDAKSREAEDERYRRGG